MKLAQLKTIDINALEWRDRVNGNSYFSALVVLNYGMPTEETIKVPFQYGYGDAFKWEAFWVLVGRFPRCKERKDSLGGGYSLRTFCDTRGIILRTQKTKALKRECIALVS